MGRRKKTVKTKKDSNVVVKTDVYEDESIKECLGKIKEYCTNIRTNNECDRCMFSTVLYLEGTQSTYPFCNLRNKYPMNYQE